MELTPENEPDAFCDICGELLPQPSQEEIGEGTYQLKWECTCGETYYSKI